MSESQVSQFLSDLRSALHRLENLPIPTIAAIDGAALGGGLELALACDFRIAGMHVQKIGFPETRLGIIPAAGGTQRASRLLGKSKAKDLIYTGRLLSGSEAAAWGLVNYVSDSESTALARSLALAQEILPSAPLAISAAKAAISQAVDKTLEEGLDLERQCYQPLLASQDRVEALKAFKEKRAPVFQGI
ncbi:ClpP/crotonase [Sistotremastrum niveocremeum HHB9708]|uniref:ClpP/crotonase n=1 Tax=Sistotremastrum niveocremeum HHB9708 TaxID=1314777 RepID=A0A164ZNI7_9AGAM|nr:ClpP/crotonase [Sistotremastrum niveocremeum HHB9708]